MKRRAGLIKNLSETNMHQYPILFWLALFCFMLIPPPMMAVTWLYVNKTPRKQRLIELGYGTNNDWYRGKRIGFVDANYVLSMIVVGAFVGSKLHFLIVRRKKQGKKTEGQFDLTPNLHQDENYLKVKREFPFFYYWILTMFVLVMFGATSLFIGMGIDKGWFNF